MIYEYAITSTPHAAQDKAATSNTSHSPVEVSTMVWSAVAHGKKRRLYLVEKPKVEKGKSGRGGMTGVRYAVSVRGPLMGPIAEEMRQE